MINDEIYIFDDKFKLDVGKLIGFGESMEEAE